MCVCVLNTTVCVWFLFFLSWVGFGSLLGIIFTVDHCTKIRCALFVRTYITLCNNSLCQPMYVYLSFSVCVCVYNTAMLSCVRSHKVSVMFTTKVY